MRYGSVCSGIEAASVAWAPLGWEASWLSEIEAFPSAVLAHHYPSVPNRGDMTRFQEWPDDAIDLLVGGTPCQSFSVAGLRAGLADPRGNLLLTYLAIAARYRPRWLVWENVPGVLSSGDGRDFGSLLGGLAELGYGFAYRVLDAQFCRAHGFERAVPQRRRRVFVVGYLGDWRRAAAVLFDGPSLRGNSPPSRQPGQGTATDVVSSLTASGRGVERAGETRGQDPVVAVSGVAGTVNAGAHPGGYNGQDAYNDLLVPVAHALRAEGFDASEGGTGRGTPIVPVASTLKANNGGGGFGSDPNETFIAEPISFGGQMSVPQVDIGVNQTLQAKNPMAVAFDMRGREGGAQFEGPHDTANIRAASGGSSRSYVANWAVRRLTPTECERLQGFPEISKSVRIEVCEAGKHEAAQYAVASSQAQRLGSSEPALVHVLINLERSAVEIHRAGKLLWSASTAATPSSSPLSMPLDAFVRAAAHMTTIAVPQTPHGRAVSLVATSSFSPRLTGSASVSVSGREIEELASDAGRFTETVSRCMKFTTLPSGPSSPTSEPTLATLSCCVVAAISSCIPSEIRQASSYAVSVETVTGYTAIPFRKKPAADGPRYKALGNSMAVNVMRVLGSRIQQVEAAA